MIYAESVKLVNETVTRIKLLSVIPAKFAVYF